VSPVMDLVTLNSAEKKLVDAADHDTVADLRAHGDGERPVIRAWLLRELCTGNRQWSVKDRIRVTGGRVEGRLDLSGAHLAHPLAFTGCSFEEIDLRGARAEKSLSWTGEQDAAGAVAPEKTSIAAVCADEFESDASLTISGVTVTGVISLHWASVRGDLRLTNSHLVPRGGQAVAGRDVRVGGTLFMDGPEFYAAGEVCLRSAHVKGDLDCRHARFDNPSGTCIDGDHLVVDGEVLLQGYHTDSCAPSDHGTREDFRSHGEVSLRWAQVRRLRATGGKFANLAGYALHADALHAEAGVYLDRGFHATGEVRLVGACISGELCCTHGTFRNPDGLALNAERIRADDIYLDAGFSGEGEVRVTGAQVNRHLNATGGSFRNERGDGYALDADGLCCHGDVFLDRGFQAVGAVSLTGAEIHSELNCTAGSFHNPGGDALFADGLTTPGLVYLNQGFHAVGRVRFARATIGRQLVCTDGTFDSQHDTALDLTGLVCPGDVLLNSTGSQGRTFRATGGILINDAQITRDLDLAGAALHGDEGVEARGMRVGGSLKWKPAPPPEGPIDLSRANVCRLDDIAASWPPRSYTLTGMAYQTVGDNLTVAERKTWLRQTNAYSPDAYQQLAQVYRQAGRAPDAQGVLIASQRDLRVKERGNLPWQSRAWSRFIDLFVGYGYKLHRPFVILIVTGLLGGVVFLIANSARLIESTKTPPVLPLFYPFPYSFQLLVPGLDLREAANWIPNTGKGGWGMFMLVLTWIMIIFGWVLATAVVAGITRLFRQR
jgi:hypothetical protein